MSPKEPTRGHRAKSKEAPAAEPEARPDPVAPGARALIELFHGPLKQVSFPDVDKDKLDAAATAVEEADAEVHRLFAALEAAQAKLSEERTGLVRLSERALAYARIFAGEDEGLVASLDEIELSPPKKAGRKPKAAKAKAAPKPAKKPAEPVAELIVERDEEADEDDDDKMSA